MYDGLKLVAKVVDHQNYVTTVSSNTNIEFEGHINATTGDVKAPQRPTGNNLATAIPDSSLKATYRDYNTKTFLKVMGDTAIFTGSIQKFFKGNNYSGFTRTELIKACEKLSQDFLISQAEFKVKNFEASVTVENTPIYQSLNAFKGRYFFQDMARNNEKFGKHVYTGKGNKGDYGIKFYDKTKQVELEEKLKLDRQLQQFELKILNPRWYNNRHVNHQIHCLEDMYDRKTMFCLRDEMVDAYYDISCAETFMNYEKLSRILTPAEFMAVATLSNPLAAVAFKAVTNENTYKKYWKVYQKVLKDQKNYHCADEIEDFGYKLSDTIMNAINN